MTISDQGAIRPLPALRYETDGFRVPEGRIMGRHSAGHSFLKAFVQAARGAPEIAGVGSLAKTADAFAQDVQAIDPALKTEFIRLDDQQAIAQKGAMHLADPSLSIHATLRQSFGPAAYSLTGVTHTISSMGAMGLIADLLTAPVMPWDGLICTSEAVKQSVQTLMAAQSDYLRWRFGQSFSVEGPQLATIPLGVDCASFADFSETQSPARAALGIAPDEVAFLFLGRLSFHAKAHPLPMYLGLEEVAQKLERKLVLIQCGWFANAYIENAFRDGAARFAPSVRHVFLDGRQDDVRKVAWSACDVFMSLSDNIQETFGLTLIEAMAAGKPVIATDWDGYRQTARHGETGFMVPTSMPERFGDELALSHAAGSITYDQYLAQASALVSLDLRALCEAIEQLVCAPDLRRRMGVAGRKRAQSLFDWTVILRDYQAFWAELAARRARAAREAVPRPATQLDPGRLFATYPTRQITGASGFVLRGKGAAWQELAKHPLFGAAAVNGELVSAILQKLGDEPISPDQLVGQIAGAGTDSARMIEAIALLTKMGLVERA
ncbi:MAG: hypothetical protein RIQ68_416 [Pseudomonadota bacterium]